MKVIDTPKLLTLHAEARKRNHSRFLAPGVVDRLDPGGRHVISGTTCLVADGAAVRCLLFLKFKDRELPLEAWLDIVTDAYNAIPEHVEEKAPEEPVKEEGPWERLCKALRNKLGNDWRKDVTVTLRADTLSWLVHLAERGINARAEDFRSEAKDRGLDAASVASLSSWSMDLDDWVAKIVAALDAKPKSKK
jgi:hypothetical protein